MGFELTADETAILNGRDGDAEAMALRLVADTAKLMGAEKLIPVASAHIDGALYHGDSGTLFAEKLVELGAKVKIRSTLNVGALDLVGCSKQYLPPHERDMAKRMMRAYEAMGCEASWTCSPYQAGHRPATGSDVAWGESNAVVFCNSVLGARTNRYGDFLDIAAAIAGRAPYYGLHKRENRRATIVVDVSALSDKLKASDILYPVLGTWFGLEMGTSIGVVDGLQGFANEDQLKAFGAASASSGGVGLFHIAGVTPEAATIADATQGFAPERVIKVTPDIIRGAIHRLSTTTREGIDAIAIGSPHLSIDEVKLLGALINGRTLAKPVYACTGRHVIRVITEDGTRAALEKVGVIFVADTCVVVTPMLPKIDGVLMTNSGKFAHYAPGNTGYAVQYGSLADCVESAVTGRLIREDAIWH